jgi:hypothetical protein
MIITDLNWAQVNDAIDTFQSNGISYNEPMCTARETGLYEIEIEIDWELF